MRFLVDECAGPSVARWLLAQGHDVFSVYDQARSADDEWVLQKATAEDRVLITADKDFGERIFRDGQAHRGVVLLRLDDERAANKISTLSNLLQHHTALLHGGFVVVTEKRVRFAASRGRPEEP